ncbi:MAG: putative zinc-binding metallopeptidase [Mediterranea sp.]|jgi:substrate import-associated zinc metallohydrolase lipoprotein|nr:putative zinc-binding metallopeptidase [Mediterranea sp.]
MEKVSLYYITALLLVASLGACGDDKLGDSIFVDSTEELNPLDQWLLDNYTAPYNIDFRYKWTDKDEDYNFDYTPASYDKSIIVANALKYAYLDVLSEAWGENFTRGFVPRVINLVGTAKYTSATSTTATVTNAFTTNGMKITINRVNETPDQPTIGWLSDHWLKTIYHESCHALADKKPYPDDFKTISNTNYLGEDWNISSYTLAQAHTLGFVSRYARENDSEDFVETLSIYVTRSKVVGDGTADLDRDRAETWGEIMIAAGDDGAAIINKKLDIIKNYLKSSWGVSLDDLRRVFERHAEMIGTIDLSKLEEE